MLDGSRRVKWEANENMVIKAVETGDGIHSHLYIWEGSYNPESFEFDESGNWICDPKRGKTKTYSRFVFNTRLDGKKTTQDTQSNIKNTKNTGITELTANISQVNAISI